MLPKGPSVSLWVFTKKPVRMNLIINTPWAKRDAIKDESAIRKAAIKYKVPYITTLAGAYNTVKGIAAARNGHGAVKSLQEYHASIEEV